MFSKVCWHRINTYINIIFRSIECFVQKLCLAVEEDHIEETPEPIQVTADSNGDSAGADRAAADPEEIEHLNADSHDAIVEHNTGREHQD